jgi:hypothetical protein
MKVLVIVKATPWSEKGVVPDAATQKMFADMGKFNDKLAKAGIIEFGAGLKPSVAGKRVAITDEGHTTLIDGPFVETKELVAGFWIWEVKSMEEAIAWAKRCPNPMPGEEGVLEIRPFDGMVDLAELMPKRKAPKRTKAKAKARKKSKAKPARRRK